MIGGGGGFSGEDGNIVEWVVVVISIMSGKINADGVVIINVAEELFKSQLRLTSLHVAQDRC